MAIGLKTEATGDRMAICKFDARSGRMFLSDRSQDASGTWVENSTDITTDFTAAFDFANLEIGWLAFLPTGPDFKMQPLGTPLPARPSENHKQGFRLHIYGTKLGGWREWCHTAKCVLGAVDALHDQYMAAPERLRGLLPVVRLSGTTPIKSTGKGQTSTNYAPVLDIVQWFERPADGAAAPAPAQPMTMAAAIGGFAPSVPAAQPAANAAPQQPATNGRFANTAF